MDELSIDKELDKVKEILSALHNITGEKEGAKLSTGAVKAILSGVSCVVRDPLLDIMNVAECGLEPARNIAENVTEMTSELGRELDELAKGLGIDFLLSNLTPAIQNLSKLLDAASDNAELLYPHLVCCSVPVNPATLYNLKRQYQILEKKSEAVGNTGAARAMRGVPSSSQDIVSNMNSNFKDIAGHLIGRLENLDGIHARLEKARQSLRDLEYARVPFDQLIIKQSEISSFAERVSSLFTHHHVDSPAQCKQFDEQQTDEQQVAPKTILSIIEEGLILLRSAKEFKDPLETIIDKVKTVGSSVANLRDELTDIFNTTQQHLSEVAESMKAILKILPAIAAEIEHFFIPFGAYSLILNPSNSTRSMIDAFKQLNATIPRPEDLEQIITTFLHESESAQNAESINYRIEKVINPAIQLSGKMQVIGNTLPANVVDAATTGAKIWISTLSQSLIDSKQTKVMEALGGHELTTMVTEFIPLVNADFLDQTDILAAGKPSLISSATNALKSLF
jgi:hypothetical protein